MSHELYKEQRSADYQVLEQIGVRDKTIITVYNKIDKLPADSPLVQRLAQEENSICISAKKNLHLEELLQLIAENLQFKVIEEDFLIPYRDSDKAAKLHGMATVLEQEYLPEGTRLKVRCLAGQLDEFAQYLVEGEKSDGLPGD